MEFVEKIKQKAKSNLKTIVLPEAEEERNLKAADRILSEGFAKLILIGNPEKVHHLASELYLENIAGAEIVDPNDNPKKQQYVDLMLKLRASKGLTAEQAEKLADRQVIVLPTRTVPMGITAMLNFDPSVNAETNTINMMAAADKVSTGLITYAARDSEYDGKRIKKGEIMALENGKIVSTSNDITKATYRLARGMCKKDSSFVTIISGCDVSDEDAEKVTEIVKAKCPNHVEVSHIRGGQPVYYYMISVE